jgi:transposase-like protein
LLRHRWSITDARAALAAMEASGLPASVFAVREGLDVNRLYRWRRRLEREAAERSPEFVELRPRGAEPVEVVLRSGQVLRVSETIDPSALARLVAALEGSGTC